MINKNLKNKKGIYMIVNSIDGKKYIGSSINIFSRWTKHQSLLKNNKHENQYLQNAVNKYGFDNFVFSVLTFTENKDDLIGLEQHYIDRFNPEYNLIKDVIRKTLTATSRKKVSNSLKKLYEEGYIQTQHTTVKVYTIKGEYIDTFYTIAECAKK